MKALLSLALAFYSFILIQRAMPGLPDRIPTKFDGAGRVTHWGDPTTLWVLLAAQVLGTAVILAIPAIGRRAPQFVNLGWRRLSDFSSEARERVMPLLEDMSGYLAILFSLFFVAITRGIIRAATSPGSTLDAWPLAGFFAGTAAVLLYYLVRINRIEGRNAETHRPSG